MSHGATGGGRKSEGTRKLKARCLQKGTKGTRGLETKRWRQKILQDSGLRRLNYGVTRDLDDLSSPWPAPSMRPVDISLL